MLRFSNLKLVAEFIAICLVLVVPTPAYPENNVAVIGDFSDGITQYSWIFRFEIKDKDSHVPLADARVEFDGSYRGAHATSTLRTNPDGLAILILSDCDQNDPYGSFEITLPNYRFWRQELDGHDLRPQASGYRLEIPGMTFDWNQTQNKPADEDVIRALHAGTYARYDRWNQNAWYHAPCLIEMSVFLERISQDAPFGTSNANLHSPGPSERSTEEGLRHSGQNSTSDETTTDGPVTRERVNGDDFSADQSSTSRSSDNSTEQTTNIALHALARSRDYGTYLGHRQIPQNINDGDQTSFWAGMRMPAWCSLEFDREYMIQKLRCSVGAHTQVYELQISQDGESWLTVATHRSPDNKRSGDTESIESFEAEVPNRPARFVRVNVISTDAPASHIFQAIVYELEVYGR